MSKSDPIKTSNLESLFRAFSAAPFKVAPEREEELVNIRDKHNISIELDDNEKNWIFEARPLFGLNRITVSTRSLERLWSVCYAYTSITTELQQYQGEFSSFVPPQEYALAFQALDWVSQNSLEDIELPWPDHLPNPRTKSSFKYSEAADHYFLMTAGRILLHEIAHIEHSHATDVNATSEQLIQEELEADDWADQWMLGDWKSYKEDPKVFIGRCMGIAFCHAIVLYFGSRKATPSVTHPNPIDRLVNFVDNHIPSGKPTDRLPEHAPCGMLVIIISHLLMSEGIERDLDDMEKPYTEVFKRFRRYFN